MLSSPFRSANRRGTRVGVDDSIEFYRYRKTHAPPPERKRVCLNKLAESEDKSWRSRPAVVGSLGSARRRHKRSN